MNDLHKKGYNDMKLNYVPIAKDNIDLAAKIQQEIFPEESAYEHYKWTIEQNCIYQNIIWFMTKTKL